MLETVTPPTEYPVTLAEAKLQLGIGAAETAFDTLINAYIAAATANAEAVTGLRIMPQVVKLVLPAFPDKKKLIDLITTQIETEVKREPVDLIAAPVKSITTVAYTDENGDAQTLTGGGTNYWPLGLDQQTLYPFVIPERVAGWPSTLKGKPDAVQITMVAGYDSADDVPGDIKVAILMRISSLFDSRGEATVGTIVAKNLNTMHTMLSPYKRVRAG